MKALAAQGRNALVTCLSALLPGYFGAIGARAFIRPARSQDPGHWQGAFACCERHEVAVAGLRVPYWQAGSGPLVLLVHGWERDHCAMGGFVAPLLNAGYSVAALDLPAHGEADGHKAPLPLLAQAIAAVASATQASAVIAHSIGGAMTVLAIEAYGFAPDCAVLISAPRSAKDYALAQGKRQGLAANALRAMLKQISLRLAEPIERFRVDLGLAGIKLPVLLIHAEDDSLVPLQDALQNAQASSAQTAWMASGGHNRLLGDSRVIDQVLQWLQR